MNIINDLSERGRGGEGRGGEGGGLVHVLLREA